MHCAGCQISFVVMLSKSVPLAIPLCLLLVTVSYDKKNSWLWILPVHPRSFINFCVTYFEARSFGLNRYSVPPFCHPPQSCHTWLPHPLLLEQWVSVLVLWLPAFSLIPRFFFCDTILYFWYECGSKMNLSISACLHVAP